MKSSFFKKLLLGGGYKKIIFVILIINLLLASWYFLRGDLLFHTDLARDFLLLDDLQQKKFVLIGARAGAAGFFHGPIWMYLNLPVFVLSNGNPIASGWFWIALTIIFLFYSFKIVKNFFDERTAYVYILLISSYLVFFTREYSHQYLGMMLMPLFFYTFVKYLQTLKARYLGSNVILGGLLIQAEIAYGGPLSFLSFLYLFYTILRHKKFLHILLFGLILLPLSTYIIFDLRHNFFLLNNFLVYLRGNPSEYYVGFFNILLNRIEYIFSAATPLIWNLHNPQKILAALMLGILFKLATEDDKKSRIYRYFFYFFLGFFILSLSNRYYLLVQHFLGFIPIVFMMIASLLSSRFAKYLVLIFLIITLNNEVEAIQFAASSSGFTGQAQTSWKFYETLGQKVFAAGSEREFGYFIWTPDKFAYAPRFAMIYGQRTHPEKTAHSFAKKPITYIIMAPPPQDDLLYNGEFWKTHSININKKPVKITSFPNGYRIERYELSPEEVAIPFDSNQDMGIHFR